ncbi:hypothetical protein Tco_0813129 [Tanacetum coccineum]
MLPRMTTRSAGQVIAAPRGGRTGRRTGRGGGRTRGRSGDQGNGGHNGQGVQVGGQGNQGSNLGNGRNQNGDAVNENIRGDVRNVIENDDREHLSPMERPDKISIGDRGGFEAWFANRV